jgi:uncharacterized membrane-anchored protein
MKIRAAMAAGVLMSVFVSGQVLAQGPQGPQGTPEEFEAKLGYQTGTVHLQDGMATIRLPESFRFIGAEGSRRLLTEGWGNPAGATDGVLGMMIPSRVSPLTREGWGIVISYDEDGYVNDDDAKGINYTKLLKEMQDETVTANEQRKKQGFEPVSLVGWAEPPSYDATAHKLYWAKELAFGGDANHTLNYNIRILGRRGVLVLNAVASMNQLEAIRSETRNVMSAVEFNDGHRYADYLPGTDKAATYGVAGLILGATAAKAGFFKMLLVGLLAFKKALVVGFLALVAAIKRLFGQKPQQEMSSETA